MSKIKVSVLCMAYNHERYIRQALDGFVMQKTNFPFEVLIHDDASTDGTAKIIREYADKYPEIIKPIFQTKNQWQQGISADKKYNWPRIQGEYVALNEGDDYWTDENKLQKQVDFLDAHPNCALCFHPVKVIWENKSKPDTVFPTPKFRFNKTILTIDDLLKHNFIQTNSVMYRWRMKNKADLFPKHILPGDWFLHLLHAQVGKIGFLPDVMSVYRKHSGSVWYDRETMLDSFILKNARSCLHFYECVEEQFNCDKKQDRLYWVQNAVGAAIRNNDLKLLKQISDMEPELFTQSVPIYEKSKYTKLKYKRYFNTVLVLALVEMLIIIGVIL